MTGEVLSAGWLSSADVAAAETEPIREQIRLEPTGWNPEGFGREQIRGLARTLFSPAGRPVRQVVFSAIDLLTDVQTVCKSLGEALALETQGRVAVAGVLPQAVDGEGWASQTGGREGVARPTRVASRTQANLWLVAGPGWDSGSAASLHQYLSHIRGEFEFSIVAARAADRYEAIAMSQFADGIVLVLSAQHSRRVAARRMKDALEGSRARLLGTVLTDRLFPMPEAIYRRL